MNRHCFSRRRLRGQKRPSKTKQRRRFHTLKNPRRLRQQKQYEDGLEQLQPVSRGNSHLELKMQWCLMCANVPHMRERRLKNNQRVDFFLPQESMYCEMDGIGHFRAIYGLSSLQKAQLSDYRKNKYLLCHTSSSLVRIDSTIHAKHYMTIVDYVLSLDEKDPRFILFGQNVCEKYKDTEFEDMAIFHRLVD